MAAESKSLETLKLETDDSSFLLVGGVVVKLGRDWRCVLASMCVWIGACEGRITGGWQLYPVIHPRRSATSAPIYIGNKSSNWDLIENGKSIEHDTVCSIEKSHRNCYSIDCLALDVPVPSQQKRFIVSNVIRDLFGIFM